MKHIDVPDTCSLEKCASCSGEFCRVPFPSYVSDDDHKHIRVVIESWLRDKGILSQARMREIHSQVFSEDEWQSVQTNPGHYWPALYSHRMTKQELAPVGRFLPGSAITDDKGVIRKHPTYERFLKASWTWALIAEMMFYHNQTRFPTADERVEIYQKVVGPQSRAFFVLADMVAGLKVEYDWADRVKAEYQRLNDLEKAKKKPVSV
ncbi:hypothetical protein FJZ17_01785 [Candidatus Pacearchaeota archaeon]|nr:hypothetical protein [Candidatus Pacearchaeota archaeon]